jgi:CRISPR-associated protein Cas2
MDVRFLLIYDITSDPLRTEVAEVCKDFGLRRVQYSCFAGHLSSNKLDMLKLDMLALLRRLDATSTDSIIVLPACGSCTAQRWTAGPGKHFPDKRRDQYEFI